MYTQDVIDEAEDLAEAVAVEDRMHYSAFIEAGEQFAAENELVISDPTALLDTDAQISIDSFQYKFYSRHAALHARNLGDLMWKLSPDGLGHYTSVITKVASYILIVTVNGRDLFTITALPTYRGVQSADILLTNSCPARFAKNSDGTPLMLLCIGPEVGLLSIYASLCNPALSSSWVENLLLESKLRTRYISTDNVSKRRISGEPPYYLMKYISGPGRVLIGPAAIAALVDKRQPGDERLQIITVTPLEQEAKEITALIDGETVWKIENLKIPSDHRVQRLTVHMIVDGRREALIDVYNSAAFDLIPYTVVKINHTDVKIGTPFVLMRYRLIDMWTIQILIRMNAIDANYAKKVLSDMRNNFSTIATYYTSIYDAGDIDKILPYKSYIGRLEDPELALKRAAQASAKYYAPYLPAARKSQDLQLATRVLDADDMF